jgi:Uncharacterised protein family UPF0547
MTEPTADSQTKVCPQCAEEVKSAAVMCRFCRYEFATSVVRYRGDWRVLASEVDALSVGDDVSVVVDDERLHVLKAGNVSYEASVAEVTASGSTTETRLHLHAGKTILLDWWAGDDGHLLRSAVTSSTVSPAKPSAKAPWFVALGVVGVIVIGAVAMSGVLAAKHTLTGSLVVPAADNMQTLDWLGKITTSSGGVQLGGPCSTSGVYSDISAGNDVTVRDETDRVVGTVALGSGTLGFTSTAVCVFTFTVPDVPAAKFITVEVGHRGSLTFSAADLDTQHWSVQIQASEVGG